MPKYLSILVILIFIFCSAPIPSIAQKMKKPYRKYIKLNQKRLRKAEKARKKNNRKLYSSRKRKRPSPTPKRNNTFSSYSLRHYKGLIAVEAKAGVTEFGNYFGAAFSQYLSSNSYYSAFAFSEIGTASAVDYQSFGVDIIYNYTFIKLANIFFLNAGAGATAGYDLITSKEVLDMPPDFNVGGLLNLESEIFFTNKIALTMQANQRLFLKSSFGDKRWFAGFGLKYCF